jgi:hypothetical protein
VSAWGVAEFGSKANRTVFKGRIREGESRNTTGIPVHLREAAEIEMAKALMP